MARTRGYAVNNEEVTLGRCSIAAPIFKSNGQISGAVSLTYILDQIENIKLDSLAHDLRITAGEISGRLGYYPTIPEEVQKFNTK
jgi:DNA-binding IclR family transcriptional regulator